MLQWIVAFQGLERSEEHIPARDPASWSCLPNMQGISPEHSNQGCEASKKTKGQEAQRAKAKSELLPTFCLKGLSPNPIHTENQWECPAFQPTRASVSHYLPFPLF